MNDAIQTLQDTVGIAAACRAVQQPRASFYRSRRRKTAPARPSRRPPARTLSPQEREHVLQVARSDRFVDLAPAQIYAQLLDEGVYVCSIRTMYRVLGAEHEVRERRNQLRHPAYRKPELLATGPNQVWSWDITKLLGPVKWTYFHLYVILDIFSRYVVGWMVAHRESDALAARLIAESCSKQSIQAGTLTIHADRSPSMRSKTVAMLLTDLDITKTHNRPHVSNDNPFSEAQFKTLKYRPDFPERFGSIQDARALCQRFFPWYNTQHRHSALGLLTPVTVHSGRTQEVLAARRQVLLQAYAAHPERFVRCQPEPKAPPAEVWINPPDSKRGGENEAQ